MSAMEKLYKWQKKHRYNNFKAAKKLGISELLLFYLKNGDVTHPEIAKHVGEIIGLTELETEEFMPLHLRPHGNDYDPERYKIEVNSRPFVAMHGHFPINLHTTET